MIKYFLLLFLGNGNFGLLNSPRASLVVGFVFIRGDFSLFKNLFWEGEYKVRADVLRHFSYNLVPPAIRTISSEIICKSWFTQQPLYQKGTLHSVPPWSHHTADTFAVLPHHWIRSTWLYLPMAALRSKAHTHTGQHSHTCPSSEICRDIREEFIHSTV